MNAQAELLRLIWGPAPDEEVLQALGLRGVGPHAAARGFSAYREHAKALSVRALASAFPRVQAALGESDFAGLAWTFARSHPPERGDLAQWGAALPDFLALLPGMDEEPPALARLDWALHRIASLADESQDQRLIEALQSDGVETLTLRVSASLQALWLPATALEFAGEPEWHEGEGRVLVWRQGWRPVWAVVPEAWWVLLQALQHGESLGVALEQAMAEDPQLDAGACLHRALSESWLLGRA